MAPTPQLIWRIPQNMELMDRRRAVWIPLGRHPHRYLGRGIIGFDRGNGIVLDHRSRLRSDEKKLNSPQRLRFCSVLWSWSWFVCSRAPGKRSGDQIWSDLDFGGFLCRIVGGRYKGFPPSAQKELLPYVFTCETSSCQLRDRSRHSPELDISTPATCRAQIAAPCWVRAQVREFVKTFPFVVLTQWRLDGIFMMTDPSISQRWWRLLGDELVISLNGQTWFPACNA